jgi:hypothetical protein
MERKPTEETKGAGFAFVASRTGLSEPIRDTGRVPPWTLHQPQFGRGLRSGVRGLDEVWTKQPGDGCDFPLAVLWLEESHGSGLLGRMFMIFS